MKHLKTIRLEENEMQKGYNCRQAARAVLFDNNNKVAILEVTKLGYHKIPGGGIEEGEDKKTALKRECLEETGCNINIKNELGIIIEYKDEYEIKQNSHCYLAKVSGQKGKVDFTEKEKSKGFVLRWINLDEAIKLFEKDKTKNYEGGFIRIRDLIFLKEAKKYI